MSDDATLDEFANMEEKNKNRKKESESVFGDAPNDWDVSNLNNSELFSSTSSGLEEFSGSKIYVPTAGVEGGQIVDNDGYTNYEDRPSRANLELSVGDVIFAKMEDSIKVLEASEEISESYIFSTGFIRITPKDKISSEFIKQVLLSDVFNQAKDSLAIGSTQPAIRLSDLSALNIPLPPFSEQQKIATVLHTVDQAIQKTEEVIEQTHTVKKSLTQDIFHGYHKDFRDYHTTPVGEIPIDWSIASIGDVVHTAQYGISESMSEEGQYPIFRMNNIENGHMIDKPLKYIDLDDDEFEKYRVERGDILFNRTNSLKLVGKTGIYQLDGDHVFASYLVRLQTNDRVKPYYLNYYMNSSEAQNRMMDFATKGVSQANINANSIQQVKMPLPPIEEQKEIVGHLRSIDSQIESNRRHLSQLKRIKNGLMRDLLSGEVRTTNTNIEIPEEIKQYG